MPIHVRAQPGELADLVLLPGDPDRAEHIARHFLDDARCYNSYRHLFGFTGRYRGVPVSVQTTGMGAPSAAIVCHELLGLGAKVFLRVGTCGALQAGLDLGDCIAVSAATPLDGATQALMCDSNYAPSANFELLQACVLANAGRQRLHVGPVATCDLFYEPRPERFATLRQAGVLALEMETSVVFSTAALAGCRAGCLLTVSDIIATRTRAEPERLAEHVELMLQTALDALLILAQAPMSPA